MDMTKATLMRAERVEMPPPPSPAARHPPSPAQPPSPASRHQPSTAVIRTIPSHGPISPYTELFSEEQPLTDCRAVPGFLFSPGRLQELGGGGRRPRYQDLPLEYSQPGSVDSTTAMDCPASPRPVSRLLGSQPLESPAAATPTLATPASALLDRPHKVVTSTATAPPDTQASPATSLTPSSPQSSYSAMNSSPTSRKGPVSRATAVPDASSVKARSTPSSAVFISPRKRPTLGPAPASLTSRGSWRFSASPPPEPYHPIVTVDSGLLDPAAPPVPAPAQAFLLPKRQKVEKIAVKTDDGTGKRVGRRLQCRECGARCSSLQEVGSHTCRPRLPCWDCRPVVTTFHSRRELADHLVLSHPAGPRQSCPHCLDRVRTFPTKTALQEHLRTRHPGLELPGLVQVTAPCPAPAITLEPAPDQSSSLLPAEQPKSPAGSEELIEVMESGTAVEVGGARYEVEEVEMVVSDRAEPCSRLEQEVDAPDSVQSQQPATPAAPFICLLCGKGFQTTLRHSNHKLHCTGGTRARPANGAAQRGRSGNARFAELRVHWTDLLAGRQRCPKCGRTNYSEAELADHSVACRGQLLQQTLRHRCPYCVSPARLFSSDASMRRHVSTNHAKEAGEDEWDYRQGKHKLGVTGLAASHLFR